LDGCEVPLTPAENMKRIREIVNSVDEDSSEEAYDLLVDYTSRLERLRARITELERQMLVRERPFVSHAPLVGPLIVKIRTFWNWMSTKWYMLPILRQQNAYNMAVAQTLREVVMAIESLSQSVQKLKIREELSDNKDHISDNAG